MDQEQNTTPKDDGFPAVLNTEKSNLSMFVGVGAFIIILVGLGWYMTQTGIPTASLLGGVSPQTAIPNPITASESTSTSDAATKALETQGTSDATSAIEVDLNATDLNSFGDITNI